VQDVDATMQDAPDTATPDQAPVTDDDWLRSRTNRVLDLVEDDDVPAAHVSAPQIPAAEKRDSPLAIEQQPEPTQPADTPVVDAAPSEEDKIRETGRLYLRNLHFEVAEEDIRNHFSKYGSLDEVSLHSHFLCNSL
jgi:multiple RNA-binding domain-containing protein 1